MPGKSDIFDAPEYRHLEDLIWELADNGSEVDLDSLIPPDRPDFRAPLERVLRRAHLHWIPCPDEREGFSGPLGQREPTVIGRYQIRQELGQGTFGKVYLAHDPELDRPVAIKIPHATAFASTDQAEQFLNEARLAAQLKHPGIVTIYDAGRDGQRFFIVMEYINGETLSQFIEPAKTFRSLIISLLAEVADALHYAHKAGFIHRDLKPGNVLVDAQGHPHIADFGLALSEATQHLKAGQVAGTPAYMSPEQVRGEAHRLDGRTDIWSFGVILYEALTGRAPFHKDDPARCFDEILHREPKPPRQFDDSIPSELEAVCLRCLSKESAMRFSNAADVARALRSFTAPPEKRRWRTVLAITGVLSLLALCTLVPLLTRYKKEAASKNEHQSIATTSLDPTVARDHPAVADLLTLVYNETLEGKSPTAWSQIERKAAATDQWRHLENGSSLSSDDRYRVLFRSPEEAYFYVVQIDTQGHVDWAFPTNPGSRHSSGSNPVPPNTTIKVPEGQETAFFLDDSSGLEHLYIIVTHKRWQALESKLAHLLDTRLQQATVASQFQKPLGLELRGIGGIAVESESTSPPDTGVQGVLAKEVWFHHVPPQKRDGR